MIKAVLIIIKMNEWIIKKKYFFYWLKLKLNQKLSCKVKLKSVK